MKKEHEPRTYRDQIEEDHLVSFTVTVKETDLFIRACHPLEKTVLDLILLHRGYLERFIEIHPEFLTSLVPLNFSGPMPRIVRDMIEAGNKAGVGPMAAVAGAVAERVGMDLIQHSDQVIIENGGDVFIKTREPVVVALSAGNSPLSMKVGLKVFPANAPTAVCTSSGTVGHSLSFGKADAVCVVSDSCPLADAAATAIGNLVQRPSDIEKGIELGKNIGGVTGVLIVVNDRIGAWGKIELVPIRGKKG